MVSHRRTYSVSVFPGEPLSRYYWHRRSPPVVSSASVLPLPLDKPTDELRGYIGSSVLRYFRLLQSPDRIHLSRNIKNVFIIAPDRLYEWIINLKSTAHTQTVHRLKTGLIFSITTSFCVHPSPIRSSNSVIISSANCSSEVSCITNCSKLSSWTLPMHTIVWESSSFSIVRISFQSSTSADAVLEAVFISCQIPDFKIRYSMQFLVYASLLSLLTALALHNAPV